MYSIYKYSLPIKEKHSIELPKNSIIIRVGDVDGLLYLWAKIDLDQSETEIRYLELYKTGQLIETDAQRMVFIGICKLFIAQELCLYVFEITQSIQPYTT